MVGFKYSQMHKSWLRQACVQAYMYWTGWYYFMYARQIITFLTLWDKIESRVKSEKQPTSDLRTRVEVLERRDLEYKTILAGYEEKLQRDYDSINAIKKTMNLMLEAQGQTGLFNGYSIQNITSTFTDFGTTVVTLPNVNVDDSFTD